MQQLILLMLIAAARCFTAVEVGMPKLGNCLEMYTCRSQCPICAQHVVYKLGHSLYTEAIYMRIGLGTCVHFQAVSI